MTGLPLDDQVERMPLSRLHLVRHRRPDTLTVLVEADARGDGVDWFAVAAADVSLWGRGTR